jgi:hypothetical protein
MAWILLQLLWDRRTTLSQHTIKDLSPQFCVG